MTKVTPEAFKIIYDLRQSQPEVWNRFCSRVNDDKAQPLLVDLLRELTTDASTLLDDIEDLRDTGRSDKEIRVKRETRKPRREIMRNIAVALGEYPLKTIAHFDPRTGKVMRAEAHGYEATVDQLIAFGFGIAVSSGDWRGFRRCLYPKCLQYFYQHKGGRVQRYCKESHRVSHANMQ